MPINLHVGAAVQRRRSADGPRVRSAGFTIIETMIVLGVTGALFVAAVLLINGRQNRTQFMTGINLFQQELQQIINETTNGFYPRDTAFSCVRGSSAPPQLSTAANIDRQGQNPDCIFLGKVLQFGVQNTDPQKYAVIPIIGNRMDTTNSIEASTLYGPTGTFPEAAAAGTTLATNSTLQGIDTSVQLTQGLSVVSMWYGTNATDTTGTVAFISSLPTPTSTGVASGTQSLGLYTVASTALQRTTPQTVDAIYPGVLNSQPLVAVTSVNICVASGTTNQSGLITIGANDASASSSLAVNLTIRTGQTC